MLFLTPVSFRWTLPLNVPVLWQDMYGLIKADNPKEASEKMISKAAFTEMDKVGSTVYKNKYNHFIIILIIHMIKVI